MKVYIKILAITAGVQTAGIILCNLLDSLMVSSESSTILPFVVAAVFMVISMVMGILLPVLWCKTLSRKLLTHHLPAADKLYHSAVHYICHQIYTVHRRDAAPVSCEFRIGFLRIVLFRFFHILDVMRTIRGGNEYGNNQWSESKKTKNILWTRRRNL